MIHVVCLKWGTKFGPEYVNNLFAGILRHSSVPVTLHCFTDDPTGINVKGTNIHPLPFDNLEGWWNKLYLFSNDMPIPKGEKIVFFDLDTIVTNNIDTILTVNANRLIALRDFFTGIAQSVVGDNNMGSGFMAWTHGQYSAVWDQFIKNPAKVIKSVHPHGDQRWIQIVATDRVYWQDIFPDRVVSFKVHCRNGLPPKAAVVCYHGIPSIPDSITTKTKTFKWLIQPQPWVADHWRSNDAPTTDNIEVTEISVPDVKPITIPKVNPPVVNTTSDLPYTTYFKMIDPNDVFGMVGRCGGGHNTIWEDWSPEGRENREHIIQEFEDGINNICGHYSKLEESILEEGFRNPLIITFGRPVRKDLKLLPPEMRNNNNLLLEGTTGGSRLWVAQKHKFKIPCFINDFTGTFNGKIKINTLEEALVHYKDKPANLFFDTKRGLIEGFDNKKVGHHLGPEWQEDKLVVERAPLWVSIMNKYGYYVDKLSLDVVRILQEANIHQRK